MTTSIPINLACEDPLSEAALRKILAFASRRFDVQTVFMREGFGYLKARIAGWNQAARFTPFLVLADLDRATCAPALRNAWLPRPCHANLLFRVAVREVESWLLADRTAFAKYFAVPETLIARDPDAIPDPKRELIQIVGRSSKREFREAIVPARNTHVSQGPDYNGVLAKFVEETWSPAAASAVSNSLRRTIVRVTEFARH